MRHFAVTAVLAFVFAMTLDLRVADSTAISADLYISQFCAGCALVLDDTSKTDLDLSRSIETTAEESMACKSHGELYCINFDNDLWIDIQSDIVNSIDARLGPEISNLQILIEYQNRHQEKDGCSYLESKMRDPSRVREDCDDVEPSSDHFEFVSVFTLTTVSVISFALLAGVWLLHRSFRNWQLRNIIARDQTNANLQLRKGRRRSSRPIRG
jgi:hypothetical protein